MYLTFSIWTFPFLNKKPTKILITLYFVFIVSGKYVSNLSRFNSFRRNLMISGLYTTSLKEIKMYDKERSCSIWTLRCLQNVPYVKNSLKQKIIWLCFAKLGIRRPRVCISIFNEKKASYLDNYNGFCNTHTGINWTINE